MSNDMPHSEPASAGYELPFTPIVVAGAPRNGTHFLHALICTSAQTNPFMPECQYFYFLLEAYLRALKVFDVPACAGFPDQESFTRHHFDLMRNTLEATWRHAGRPKNLVVKHCFFTPVLLVLARQFPAMKFVVILRDARDAVASEVRVARKNGGDPNAVPQKVIDTAVDRYNLFYGAVVGSAARLGERLHCVRYERLAQRRGMGGLQAFLGLDDIDEALLWRRASFDIDRTKDFTMHSDLWGKPLSSGNIGRYRDTLTEAVSDEILRRTGRTMVSFEALHETDADCGEPVLANE